MAASVGLKRFTIMWFLGSLGTVAFLAAFTAAMLNNNGWLGYLRLVRGGAYATGIVIRTDPRNHCLTEYTFSAGGQRFTGAGSACGASAGQTVAITYLVTDPARSCLGPALAKLENELATFVLGGIIFPPSR